MFKNILLPKDYEAEFDLSADAEVNKCVIEVGYKFYQEQQRYVELLHNAKRNVSSLELKQRYDKMIEDERNLFDQKINKLKQQNLTAEKDFNDSHNKIKLQHNNELVILENTINDLRTKIDKEISKLKDSHIAELSDLKSRHNADINNLRAHTIELQSKLNAVHENHSKLLQEKENIYLGREKQYLSAINEIREIKVSIQKPLNPVETGIIGEELISNWISDLFRNAEVIDQTKKSSKGDFHVNINGKTFLIEIKNKSSIFKTDIDKFVRDVSENANIINGGLFISINTPAIPNKGDFSLEYIDDIPVIYLYVSDKSTLRVAIKTLLFLNNKSDSSALIMMINNAYNKINAMLSNHVGIEKSINDLRSLTESNRKEIKNLIINLEELFDDDPSLKFEVSATRLEFRPEEINIIRSVSSKLSKPKMSDYVSALNCTLKYLQDRGGAAGIKNIISGVNNLGNSKTIYGTNIPNVKIQL